MRCLILSRYVPSRLAVRCTNNLYVRFSLKYLPCGVLTYGDAKCFFFHNVIQIKHVYHQDPIRIDCSIHDFKLTFILLHINIFVERLFCNGQTVKHQQQHQTNYRNCIMNKRFFFCYFLSGHKKGRTPCASPINRNMRITIIFLVPYCQKILHIMNKVFVCSVASISVTNVYP